MSDPCLKWKELAYDLQKDKEEAQRKLENAKNHLCQMPMSGRSRWDLKEKVRVWAVEHMKILEG